MPEEIPARVHPVARGFDRAAAPYENARPEYPAEALRALGERLELDARSTVLDLAAGTGKLTRSLRDRLDVRVVAVEPLAAMRSRLIAAVPGVPVLDGTAERIPLGDDVVDAVVVGQAFHWFRTREAADEIARVLRPSGGLGLLWNVRDESVPWMARFGAIVRSVEPAATPSARDAAWRPALDATGRFEPIAEARFAMRQALTPEGLVERALSISYVARLPADEQARLAGRVRELAATDPALAGHARFELPYVTELYTTRRR